ncbi:MAG: chromate efflux transporter [Bacillota bacterium]
MQNNRDTNYFQKIVEVFSVASRLGLGSFGGPIAHLGYFRNEYVEKRKWIDDKSYADLVALCQFLPGPASSQVGISIGILRAGLLGGIASWIGFTFPSAFVLFLFATFVQGYDISNAGWLHGLTIVAVAVVAHAVWGMAKSLAPDKTRATIVLFSAVLTLLLPFTMKQILIILLAGIFGWLFLPKKELGDSSLGIDIPISKGVSVVSWIVFLSLLFGLPLLRQVSDSHLLAIFDSFFRVGSLVFGGGHVVLPLLQAEVVPVGWVNETQFIAGYGAAQAVPGPLFTFAAYLGAVTKGLIGSLIATVAIFLPSFLIIIGGLPFWQALRMNPKFQSAITGINAAVVGILLAALYDPIWTKAIKNPFDFSLALIAFGMLMFWKIPPWKVVSFCIIGGIIIYGV